MPFPEPARSDEYERLQLFYTGSHHFCLYNAVFLPLNYPQAQYQAAVETFAFFFAPFLATQ
jgi:hypothetical protein